MAYYRIVRFFQDGRKRTVRRVPTLALAQEHCNDPEASSNTCRKPHNRRRTRARGPWFDGYREER